MKRTLRLTAAVLALAGVVGCKMNLTTDLYSTDLRDVMAGTADMTAPATMAFEVPGVDKCDEYSEKISKIMEGTVDDFAPRGCEQDGMDSFLLANTQIPILRPDSIPENFDSLFAVILIEREIPEHIGVAIAMDREMYRSLLVKMDAEFNQTIDLASSKVAFVLNNDDRTTIKFAVVGAFVDSDPIHLEREFELARRHKAEIRLSDVATAYLVKEGGAGVFTLRGAKL